MRLFILFTVLFISASLFAQTGVQQTLNVELLNENQVAEKNKKAEFGVGLPPSVAAQVENFVRKKSGTKINPYLEWELLIQAEFSHPNVADPIIVDAFYSEDFEPYEQKNLPEPNNKIGYSDEEYRRLGGFKKVDSKFNFLVRFTPQEIGQWKCKVVMKTPDKKVYSPEFSFEVKDSDAHGFVKIDKQKRFLELDDQSFYPVGCNTPWPITSKVFDREFALKNRPHWDLSFQDAVDESYRSVYSLPRVYESYRSSISSIYDGGANMLRMIMYPSATDIEWEELGNYTDRLHMATELDKIIEVAEEKNKFFLFGMQIHYSFQKSKSAYYKRWTWDMSSNGVDFCYRDLVENPIDFFTSDESKKYYKQRLRYIVSRWGYSTSIASWELFCEISNVGARTNDNNSFYVTDDNYKIYEEWQIEMGKYIKSLYGGREHLLTSSYAGEVKFEDETYFKQDSPFDIASVNLYDFQNPDAANFLIRATSERSLNQQEGGHNSMLFKNGKHNVKPVVFSETGPEPVNTACHKEKNAIELNRYLYQQVHSGTAFGLTWSFWLRPENYGVLKNVEKWISSVDLSNENWHPGASKLSFSDSVNIWKYQPSYKSKMIGRNKKADIIFLRSEDRSKAFGVLTNLTYNVYTEGECFDQEWEKHANGKRLEKKSEVVKTYGSGGENLKVKGMKGGRYKIEYFLPTNQEKPFLSTYDTGPNVKIELDNLGNTEETYMVLFRVSKVKEVFPLNK